MDAGPNLMGPPMNHSPELYISGATLQKLHQFKVRSNQVASCNQAVFLLFFESWPI